MNRIIRTISFLMVITFIITNTLYGYTMEDLRSQSCRQDSLRPPATGSVIPAIKIPMPAPDEVKAIGRGIGQQTIKIQTRLRERIKLSNILMKWAMKNEGTKVNLLHFIDVLPKLSNKGIVKHLGEYIPFSNKELPLKLRLLAWLGRLFGRFPIIGPWAVGWITRYVVKRVARNFVAGLTPEEVIAVVKIFAQRGKASIINNLGEKVLSREEAEAYLETYLKLLNVLGRGDSISIKPSALFSEASVVDPDGTKKAIKTELYKAMREARAKGVIVNTDMEHHEFKNITLDIFMDMIRGEGEEEEFKDFDDFGTVLQTYLKDSEADLDRVIALAEEHNRQPYLRLVKGCLWEYETSMAKHKGWDVPVFERKSETDRNFNRLALKLLTHRKRRLDQGLKGIRPAFGTHNIMSIAYIISYANKLGLGKDQYEFQFLYGMGDSIALALLNMGYKVRIYTPEGKLISGMAYLVRRILENTSTDSFLRQLFLEAADLEEVLKTPDEMKEKEEQLLAHQQRQAVRRKTTEFEREVERVLHVAHNELIQEGSFIASAVTRHAKELLRIHDTAARNVISTPVEENRYFYIPRGNGLIIIDEDTSPQDFADIVAAPLVAGNSTTVFADSKFRPIIDSLTRIFDKAGKKDILKFENDLSSARAGEAFSECDWVFYKGPKAVEWEGRRAAGFTHKEQKSVKRVITQVDPDYIKNFILPKSVAINLMRRGFAPQSTEVEKTGKFESMPAPDFSNEQTHLKMDKALEEVESKIARRRRFYSLIIDGKKRASQDRRVIRSVNPADPDQIIGTVYSAGINDAEEAVQAAKNRFGQWQHTSFTERAEYLRKAGEIMKRRRFELASWMMLEVGKTRLEAIGDVDEAIDCLNYYADEIERLIEEDKRWESLGWVRESRGVCAVIAPWNFPLAILTGMVSAAIVTGNTVVMKPAEQSPVIAAKLMEIFEEAKLPPGVVNYLPGEGDVVGDYLVRHPDVDLIDFTGSEAVGLKINSISSLIERERAKVVIAEMGGKNAIIVDESADLDEAVTGVVQSFLGYSNQKCSACSRVIVHKSVYDEFTKRLVARVESLVMGDPRNKATAYGPLIDEEAREKILRAIRLGRADVMRADNQGEDRMRILLNMNEPGNSEEKGFYVKPVIFGNVPRNAWIAQEEIFGPVLSVMKAEDFEDAIDIANSTRFGLTGAVYTRTPSHIEEAIIKFMVGNLYFNRPCTGAAVKKQPFGGFFHSGIGSKAFGPDYIQQFTRWRRISSSRVAAASEELIKALKASPAGGKTELLKGPSSGAFQSAPSAQVLLMKAMQTSAAIRAAA